MYDDLDIQHALERAHARLRYGDPAGAVDILCEALAREPDSGVLHSALAQALLRQRRWTAAQHEAQQGLALEPESAYAHYSLATVHGLRGQHRRALPHLEQAVALAPEDEDYQLALARALDALGRRAEARAHFERAQQLAPDSAEVLAALGDWHFAQRDWRAARHCYQEALGREPQHAAALIGMGSLLLRAGRTEAARDHALWVLQQNAGHAGALWLLSGVKARENPLTGLWWRFNSWLAIGGSTRWILLAICLYVVVRLVSITLRQFGHGAASQVVDFAWLGFVIYTWVAPVHFQKQLRKELDQVRLAQDF